MLNKLREYIEENRASSLELLKQYVSCPSVASDSLATHKCAEFLVSVMKEAGISTTLYETAGNPIVYGEILSENENAPTILFYGHYDVQPPEPLEEWISPPFEPQLREGRLYGRGAGDNKGQHLAHILAVKAYQEIFGQLPVHVKFIMEGDEECGSKYLTPFVQEYRELLQADLVYISDGPLHESGVPLIVFGNRGVMNFSIEVETATTDHHSGNRGGVIPNAAWELLRLLQTMSDGRGKVTIDGFYDDVLKATDFEEELIASIPYDTQELAEVYGVKEIPFGRREFYERLCFQPTFSINALGSGDAQQVKNIIPAKAVAKLDIRLVANQDPDHVFSCIEKHIKNQDVKGSVRVYKEGEDMLSSKTDARLPICSKVIDAVEKAFGKKPVTVPVAGGSLPNSVWTDVLKIPAISVPYANADENNHAPNENIHIECFLQGIVTTATVLHVLGEEKFTT